ncbi:putative oxidoreductase [Streptomyces himastatinicus ATCC 53653]|uniref:Putative oxidoreductase n=1 Tax=Streptomyces himastatinicus ATCC 53653 TaxID=457427 RepID=D9WKN9_9ACTN|nr:putative oxidoreductase [Streptomyces himastatinicus ATCC 53653]
MTAPGLRGEGGREPLTGPPAAQRPTTGGVRGSRRPRSRRRRERSAHYAMALARKGYKKVCQALCRGLGVSSRPAVSDRVIAPTRSVGPTRPRPGTHTVECPRTVPAPRPSGWPARLCSSWATVDRRGCLRPGTWFWAEGPYGALTAGRQSIGRTPLCRAHSAEELVLGGELESITRWRGAKVLYALNAADGSRPRLSPGVPQDMVPDSFDTGAGSPLRSS